MIRSLFILTMRLRLPALSEAVCLRLAYRLGMDEVLCCHQPSGLGQHTGRGQEPAPLGPSPGFNNLRWLKPVTSGETIYYRSTVTGKRELNSRPGWGLVFALNEGFDQNGILTFSFEGKALTPKKR